MKKLITKFMAMCLLSVSLAAFAQSGDTKQDEMKQERHEAGSDEAR